MTQTTQPFLFAERSTQKLTGTVKDENGTPIPGASLTTFTMYLYNYANKAVINGRSNVDLKANVDSLGVLTWVMDPADNQIVGTADRMPERHVVLFKWTYLAGAKAGNQEVEIRVQPMEFVP